MLTKLLALKKDDKVYSLAYQDSRLIFAVVEPVGVYSEAIYPATITRLNYKSRSAFVRYGEDLNGFINLGNNLAVQEGSSLCIQMVWCGDGVKQPKFRSDWQLVGKYLVYAPGNNSLKSTGLSREVQTALAGAAQNLAGTWIVRSCVQFMRDIPLVLKEMQLLYNLGQNILSGGEFAGISGYLRILRSLKLASGCEVITNDNEINQQLLSYQDLWQIDAVTYNPTMVVDDLLGEYCYLLNSACHQLANGSNIEIYTMGGINLVDINSGSVVLSHDKLNFLVLDEIYRQICIRNLQGIILLDLLKNQSQSVQQGIMEYLKKLFKTDITNTRILGFSHSGLCELIRNRF